ncbi:hypothetical protein N7519_010821 [Penicillium mononematosum]|uniref:uncharacterized protein n=1 Tax=Penicillium mononematosum TaxID=268346 RepID=UPI002548CB8F|nr:uncharacterized protein N7519_010821 [Penicillium mononematosum]KAJ6180360.1 hypothetical protein N7519_010821 [Penicillium mononematosum]
MSSQNSFANASPSSNTLSASTTSTSTVRSRPRPRRLVSFMDDEDDSNNATNYSYQDDAQPFASGLSTTLAPSEGGMTRSRGATPSPLSSRGASPLPMRHPSRATESINRGTRSGPTSFAWSGPSKASSSGGAADFLDSSWSSLQSLASSVLGSDAGRVTPSNATKTHTRRKPSRSDVYIKSAPRSTWGPSAPAAPQFGTGTKEERQALVQAKKREALLLADSDPIASRTLPHKRRDSGDISYQASEPEHDEDALAYIHKVQPTDTITGVTIKYGCQAAVFRKANGFWPNDNIQSRNTVLLPVDACSVKGRPVPKKPVDLLSNNDEDPSDSSIAPTAASTDDTSTEQDTSATASEADGNHAWKHESWVHMDGFPDQWKSAVFLEEHWDSFRVRVENLYLIQMQNLPTYTEKQSLLRRLPDRQLHLCPLAYCHELDQMAIIPSPRPHTPVVFSIAASAVVSSCLARGITSNASTGLENIGGAFEGWVRKVATRAKAGINELQQGPSTPQGSSRGRNMWRMDDLIELDDGMVDGRNSPSPLKGASRRSELQGTSSSSSSNRYNSPSVVAASRSRATGFGSGSSPSACGERVKDD